MSTEAAKSILILDDDANFRQLIARLLQTQGYHVVEARSTRDASATFANVDPGLAIVDYRLPESDGISWITWLRESGRNFPVVFLSSTWCDEKTFSWLRNILKVSLILRKPIVPELFVDQIAYLLPPPPLAVQRPVPQTPKVQYVEKHSTGDEISLQIDKLNQAIEKSAPESPLLVQLIEMRAKLLMHQKLNEVKQEYASLLREEWTLFSDAVSLMQREPQNTAAKEDATQQAHRIRGTAGSMGYLKVGEAAGKIEDFLRGFDPTDTLVEVLWTEIFRSLADGEMAVREAVGTSHVSSSATSFATSVLLFGSWSTYTKAHIDALNAVQIEGVICDSMAAAVGRAKRRRFNAAVFDLSVEQPERIFTLASEIRAAQIGAPIPLAFISAGQNAPNEGSLAYAGSSAFMWNPVGPAELRQSLESILISAEGQKPRILTVDDDQVLTKFIQTILVAEGMSVETLNQPIQILSKMEDFQPDLILLDVMMPGLSGYDVCRMLRATEKWQHVPVLFLTSKSDAEGRAAAFQSGANDFLSKPVLAPEVVARVRAQLDQAGYKSGSSKGNRDGLMSRKEFVTEAQLLLNAALTHAFEMSMCLISIDDLINLGVRHGMFSIESAETQLAEMIRIHFRSDALRGTWGDGAFALAVPCENKMTVKEAIGKLLEEFADLKFASATTGTFKVSFSAGLAGIPGDEASIEGLLNLANARMVQGRKEKLGAIAAF